MKTTSKYIAMAALALCAAACSQNEEIALTFQNDPSAVRITAQVGSGYVSGGFTRTNPIGTAEEQMQFNVGDRIGVLADQQAAVIYKYNGSSWEPEEEGKYLTWQSENMNISAWYPVTSGTDYKTFLPTYSESPSLEDLQNNDYMNFRGSVTKNETASVSLALNRQMTRIVIDEIIYSGHYNASDNEVTAITARTDGLSFNEGQWLYSNPQTAPMYKHTDGKWYVVIAPCAGGSEETFLEITLNGVDEPLIVKGLPYTINNIGYSYSYTLTIVGKEEAGLGEVVVSSWQAGSVIGDAEARKSAVIDATAMSAEELKSLIIAELQNNVYTFDIELDANESIDASKEKFDFMKEAFYHANGDIDLTVSGVTSIPDKAFMHSSDYLKTVTLPDAVEVGHSAFKESYEITTINAPKLEIIGGRTFQYCPRLSKITIGAIRSAEQDPDGGVFVLTTTENVDLVLSPEQKVMTQSTEGSLIWTATEEYYKDSEDYINKSFLGYTFKSISFAE